MRLTFPAQPLSSAGSAPSTQSRSVASSLSKTPLSEDVLGLSQISTSAPDAPSAPVVPGIGARRVSFHDPSARFDPGNDLTDSPTGFTGQSAARWNGRTPSGGSGGVEGDVSAFGDDDEDDDDDDVDQDSHGDEEDDADLDEDEYSEDEESEEEDDEEEDEDEPPTSQFISALDLAGFG